MYNINVLVALFIANAFAFTRDGTKLGWERTVKCGGTVRIIPLSTTVLSIWDGGCIETFRLGCPLDGSGGRPVWSRSFPGIAIADARLHSTGSSIAIIGSNSSGVFLWTLRPGDGHDLVPPLSLPSPSVSSVLPSFSSSPAVLAILVPVGPSTHLVTASAGNVTIVTTIALAASTGEPVGQPAVVCSSGTLLPDPSWLLLPQSPAIWAGGGGQQPHHAVFPAAFKPSAEGGAVPGLVAISIDQPAGVVVDCSDPSILSWAVPGDATSAPVWPGSEASWTAGAWARYATPPTILAAAGATGVNGTACVPGLPVLAIVGASSVESATPAPPGSQAAVMVVPLTTSSPACTLLTPQAVATAGLQTVWSTFGACASPPCWNTTAGYGRSQGWLRAPLTAMPMTGGAGSDTTFIRMLMANAAGDVLAVDSGYPPSVSQAWWNSAADLGLTTTVWPRGDQASGTTFVMSDCPYAASSSDSFEGSVSGSPKPLPGLDGSGSSCTAVVGTADGRVVGMDVPSGQPLWLATMPAADPGTGQATATVSYLAFDSLGHLYAGTAGGVVGLLDNACPTYREQTAYTSVAVVGVIINVIVFILTCWARAALAPTVATGREAWRQEVLWLGVDSVRGMARGSASAGRPGAVHRASDDRREELLHVHWDDHGLPAAWPWWKRWLALGHVKGQDV